MAAIKLKYVTTDVDGNGNARYYFRRPGQRKLRLRGLPGSKEFMAAYQAALDGEIQPQDTKRKGLQKGSFAALCHRYYGSAYFKRLDQSTKNWQRRALDGIAAQHGDKPFARLEAKYIRRWMDAKAETPAAANTMLKALRALFKWAVRAGEADSNPAKDVEKIQYASSGFHTWTPDEVRQFEEKHPIGTKARLALALLLYTACRREDVVRFGPQNIRDGRLRYTQAKNEDRNPVAIDIPVHPDLAAVIAGTSLVGHSTFLVTDYGKPVSANGFGNKFKDWCREAGLPHCSAHGLRKAAATRLAEAGATAHEIQSITGHQTLEEVERYTRAAQRPGLADRAMKKLIQG